MSEIISDYINSPKNILSLKSFLFIFKFDKNRIFKAIKTDDGYKIIDQNRNISYDISLNFLRRKLKTGNIIYLNKDGI